MPTPPHVAQARSSTAPGAAFRLTALRLTAVRLAAAALAALSLAVPASVRAQRPSAGRPRPAASATRRTGPVVLNGRLDEAAWAAASPITDFTQQRPDDGAPPTERTEVRIIYDDDAVYVGARMFDSHGRAGVTSRLVRRDDSPESDVLRIDFDPYHDRLHSVEFDVNPAGWRGDATDTDRSWDPVWEAASHVDSLGWTAEVRIPLGQLRFSRDSVQAWGLNLTRITQRTQERDLWAYWSQKDPGGPSYFGDLTGLRVHSTPERVELLPYVVTRAKRLGSGDPRSPFYRPHRSDLRAGGDAKLLLTNSFTLSATVNPDFGQVEVDPAVVNLSAYETFFPEKRPFFVEGSNVFAFGQPGCNLNCGFGLFPFYTRRIGRAPQGAGLASAAGRYADVPDNTTILGAAKVTGRTQSGYSVGVIDAVTRGADAEVETADGRRIALPVEPLTNSFVGRVKRDLRRGNVVVGAMATSVDRRLDNAGLASLIPRSAETGGADVEAFWKQHTYRFYGALSASRVAGDSLAVARVQRAPARYFQRPDRAAARDGLFADAYDPSATALAGYGAIARLSKEGGSWIGDLNASSVSPGYETNDLGFLRTAGRRWVNGSAGRQFTTPTRWYRTLTSLAGAEQYRNFDGDVTNADVIAYASAQFLNYWSASLGVQHDVTAVADGETRGGPAVLEPEATYLFGNVATDPRRRVVLRTNVNGARDIDGGYSASVGLSASVRPAANVRLSVGPGYSVVRNTQQFVTSVADTTARAFFGRRYVFSEIVQRQLSMTLRGSATFTPALSLDLFVQPLIAGGDYRGFEEFAAPRTHRKLVYGRDVGTSTPVRDTAGAVTAYTIDPDGPGRAAPFTVGNPDFNFRSLRGTGVLRWEWRPGSTAYLVWTQTRNDVAPLGDLSFGRDRSALFAAPADNIFVLKVSYRLGF